MELLNFENAVVDEIFKLSSINLSSNVTGQVAVGLMVNPPREGDVSYEQFVREKHAIISGLQRRAKLITDAFNSLEGVVCQETEGSMYSFPRIYLPSAALEAAKQRGKAPDVFYCLELLEETGLCCVPGSGFQQVEGTYHFRTTILPPEHEFPEIIRKLTAFHVAFMSKWTSV